MSDKIEKIKQTLSSVEKQLKMAYALLEEVEHENKIDYKSLPGVTGIYDGSYLITESGEKYEVPSNYAAKSRLVYGDTLKMIEEGDKKLFKQIEKVNRKKVEAVVNKKEGKWFALAETGSYRLSDVAVTFNNLAINDKVQILIPEDNLNAPCAALERVLTPVVVREEVKPAPAKAEPKSEIKQEPRQERRPAPRPARRPTERTERAERTEKAPESKEFRKPRPTARRTEPREQKSDNKEFVDQISGSGSIVLEDDDLR